MKLILYLIIILSLIVIIQICFIHSITKANKTQDYKIENIVQEDWQEEKIEEVDEEEEEVKDEENKPTTKKYTLSDGKTYEIIAVLNIPILEIKEPVLSTTSTELLKIALNKYWGPEPNTVGNFCILGHNYNDERFFGKLNKIKKGNRFELTDMSGKTVEYSVYDTYIVEPQDTSCTSQLTKGKTEVTLITCNSTATKRFVVKASKVN